MLKASESVALVQQGPWQCAAHKTFSVGDGMSPWVALWVSVVLCCASEQVGQEKGELTEVE